MTPARSCLTPSFAHRFRNCALGLMLGAAALAMPAYAQQQPQGRDWNAGSDYGQDRHDDRGREYNRGREYDRDWANRDWDGRRDNRDFRNDRRAMRIYYQWALNNFDYNRDGYLDGRENYRAREIFYRLADRDGDGRISDRDFQRFVDRYADGRRNDDHYPRWPGQRW